MTVNITLPIYIYDEDSSKLEDLGIETSLKDAPTEKMTFYEINAIAPYIENGIEASTIFCNGREFICPLSYGEVYVKIRKENESNK